MSCGGRKYNIWPEIDPLDPRKSLETAFFFWNHIFQTNRSLSQNWAILCRMVNIGFLRTFRGPKGRFPAKYHISGHYMEYLRILKNRIFCDFLRFLRNFSIWLAAGIGRNQSYRPEIIKNVILKLFRCLFIYKSCLYDI